MVTKAAFAQNAQIEHPRFGCGTVLSCDEEYVIIKFDDHGEKKFVASIVVPNLKKIEREPPAGSRGSRKSKPRAKKATT